MYSAFQSTKCTKGCTDYSNETLSRGPSSNFTSHARDCKHRPLEFGFEAYKKGTVGQVALPEDSAPGQIGSAQKQRDMILAFGKQGLVTPQRTFTEKGFRERLVMTVIEDGLPFALADGTGMRRLLVYTTPRSTNIPSRSTVRRDVDHLYDKLKSNLVKSIKVHLFRICIFLYRPDDTLTFCYRTTFHVSPLRPTSGRVDTRSIPMLG